MPPLIKTTKATKSQVRQHNRQLVLRSVYTEAATSRAALALETGLTKPAVSDLVSQLIEEGLLVEEGLGESTDIGGKRPRLLRFLPDARQVIGVSVNQNSIIGVLINLDGEVIAEHAADLPTTRQDEVITALVEVINGLIAQLHAPLLCLSVGISAIVDANGTILHAPRFGWQQVALGDLLAHHYGAPVHVANSSELAALAQYTFGAVKDVSSLVTIMISNSIGMGAVMDGAAHHLGNEIGHLTLADSESATLSDVLGWREVRARAVALGHEYSSPFLCDDDLTYLKIRYAYVNGDPAAQALLTELTRHLARIFAWVIALMRPQHISLAGAIADLGEPFLALAADHTRRLVLPELVDQTAFSVDDTPNLVAIGAAARSVQLELGLV